MGVGGYIQFVVVFLEYFRDNIKGMEFLFGDWMRVSDKKILRIR